MSIRRLTHTLIALAVVLAWSVCFVVIKETEGAVPPLLYAALRALLGGVALLGVGGFVRRPLPAPGASAWRTWSWIALLGLTNTTLGLAGMFLSVGDVGAALPGVLANSQVLLVAPLAALWFGESLTAPRWAGLLAGVAGLGLVMWGAAGGLGTRSGIVLALLAAAGLAAGNLIIKRLGTTVDALSGTAWQYVLGGVALLAWSSLVEDWSRVTWTRTFIGGLLFLSLVGSAAATYVWYRLLQAGELIHLNALTLMAPVFSVVLAVWLADERLGGLEAIGIATVIAGVVVAGWPAAARSA